MEVASEASGASILERIRRRPNPLLLVAPAFLVLFLLTIYPFLYMVWISLHKWPILPTLPRIFVGADAYAYIFRDGEFWNSVGVTSSYMAVSVGLQLALGLFLAMLLDARYRAFQWFRLPFMIPVFVSPVVVGLIWKFMLGYDLGIVNHLLRSIGSRESTGWATRPMPCSRSCSSTCGNGRRSPFSFSTRGSCRFPASRTRRRSSTERPGSRL